MHTHVYIPSKLTVITVLLVELSWEKVMLPFTPCWSNTADTVSWAWQDCGRAAHTRHTLHHFHHHNFILQHNLHRQGKYNTAAASCPCRGAVAIVTY